MQLFFNPTLDHSFKQFVFSAEESKHIIKVLRKKEGDLLKITNGKGSIYTAEILACRRKKMQSSNNQRRKNYSQEI